MSFEYRGSPNTPARVIWETATDFNLGTVPATLEVSGSGYAAVV